MTTDTPASFDGDLMRLVGCDMTAAAARQVYESAGVNPRDIRVVELHDWQPRGEAGPRQVDDVSVALQHNIGLGGAAVITLYEKVS